MVAARLLHGHPGGAACGNADDHVTPFPDSKENFPKVLDVRRRVTILGSARMDVNDGRPGLGGLDRGIGDLPGSDGKLGGQRRYSSRSGDGGRDYQFFHFLSSQ